jgi:hypothetical protein
MNSCDLRSTYPDISVRQGQGILILDSEPDIKLPEDYHPGSSLSQSQH